MYPKFIAASSHCSRIKNRFTGGSCIHQVQTGSCFSSAGTWTINMDTILKDFLTEERLGERLLISISITTLYRPYLNALIESIDNRFPAIEIMEVFGMFDPSNIDTSDAYNNGKNCLIS